MATSVYDAFDTFLTKYVNLEPTRTTVARSSRKWLIEQIELIATNNDDFPALYAGKHIQYGSFARNTKIRPLDDIDLMIAFSAQGSNYEADLYGNIQLNVPSESKTLIALCNDGTALLNSRKLINILISKLSKVNQYKNADFKRNQEAAVLELSTYEWHFDIVPCFFTKPEQDGRNYYLIPDGNGNWKKTDPRIDRQRVNDVNKKHNYNVLQVIRTVKYWHKRPIMPTMPSYLLETLILYYYEGQEGVASEYVDKELSSIFNYIANNIVGNIYDPKNIQGDINTLSWLERTKIATVARDHSAKAAQARAYEINKDHKNSIRLWTEIFGDNFPSFTNI